ERIRKDAAKAVKEDYRIKDLEGENRTGELKKRMTCKAPSAVTFARGDPAMIEWPKAQVRRLFPSNESQPGIASALAFRFRLTRGLLFLTGPVQTHRNPCDKALIIRQAIVADNHTLGGDFIFADIAAMVAAAHLDNDQDLAKLVADGYIPKPDNVIGEKGNRVGTEREFCERLIHLHRAENRHPDSRQSGDHPIERFAKFRAEAGRQRHLKARQRINHQALRANLCDRVENLVHGFIHREVEGTEVEDFELLFALRLFQIQTKTAGPLRVLLRPFFKDYHNSRIPLANALGNELGCQDRFSRPRSPCHQDAIAFGNPSPEHLIQFRNTD